MIATETNIVAGIATEDSAKKAVDIGGKQTQLRKLSGLRPVKHVAGQGFLKPETDSFGVPFRSWWEARGQEARSRCRRAETVFS